MSGEVRKLTLKRELLEICMIFIFGSIINGLIWCDDCFDSLKAFIINVIISGTFWVMLWKGSQYIVIYLDSILPWIEHPLRRFIASLFSVVTYTTLVVYGLDFLIDVILMDKTPSQAIQYLNYSSLFLAIMITLGINTFLHGRGFLLGWRQASIDNERLKTETISSQYNSLKNQVNPHFLFNSLNVLSELVYDDQERAVEFIRKLSKVYRYVLDSKDEEVIAVQDEMEFVKNFVFLQKIRFGENLNVTIGPLPETGFVPPLAIQMLVENAIKHNVVSEKDPLQLKITFDDASCIVSNNLKEKKVKDSTGIGLNNLKERYKYLSNEEVRVDKQEESFTVVLPLLKMKQ